MKQSILAIFCSAATLSFADAQENFYNQDLFRPDQKIYFHHIYKIGGSSAIEFLSKNLNRQKEDIIIEANDLGIAFPTNSFDEKFKIKLNESFLKSHVVSQSHCSFIYLKDFADKINFITFLREPISRHTSHKRYYKNYKDKEPELISLFNSLDQIVTQSSNTYNLQTLFFSSLDPFDPKISIDEHLESAKYNLKYKIAFFGLTEILKESLDLYMNRFNFPVQFSLDHINSTCNLDLDIDIDYDMLQQGNWADIELYNFAKEVLFERYPFLREAYDAKMAQKPSFVYSKQQLTQAAKQQIVQDSTNPESFENLAIETQPVANEECNPVSIENQNEEIVGIAQEITQELEVIETVVENFISSEGVMQQETNAPPSDNISEISNIWSKLTSFFESLFN